MDNPPPTVIYFIAQNLGPSVLAGKILNQSA